MKMNAIGVVTGLILSAAISACGNDPSGAAAPEVQFELATDHLAGDDCGCGVDRSRAECNFDPIEFMDVKFV